MNKFGREGTRSLEKFTSPLAGRRALIKSHPLAREGILDL